MSTDKTLLNKLKNIISYLQFNSSPQETFSEEDIFFMKQAIIESQKAQKLEEIPVGCVIIRNSQIIGKGYNIKEKKNDVTAHAEIIALRQASKILQNWRLTDCILYVTKEPCPMCLSAIVQARISTVIFGMSDKKYGFRKIVHSSHYKFLKIKKWLLEKKITTNFQAFFHNIRQKNKKTKNS